MLYYLLHPRKQEDEGMEQLDNNPKVAKIKNKWTAGLLEESTLDGWWDGK